MLDRDAMCFLLLVWPFDVTCRDNKLINHILRSTFFSFKIPHYICSFFETPSLEKPHCRTPECHNISCFLPLVNSIPLLLVVHVIVRKQDFLAARVKPPGSELPSLPVKMSWQGRENGCCAPVAESWCERLEINSWWLTGNWKTRRGGERNRQNQGFGGVWEVGLMFLGFRDDRNEIKRFGAFFHVDCFDTVRLVAGVEYRHILLPHPFL